MVCTFHVNWSDEDEVYIVTVLEFPLLSTFGDTQGEAIKEMAEVLKAVLEIYKENNTEFPAKIV